MSESQELAADAAEAQAVSADPKQALMDSIVAAIKTCYDPEIPVDIWELGLVYRIDVDDDKNVEVDMTLTSPMCPVAGDLPPYVQQKVESVEGVKSCKLALVWEPPWRPDMMSDEAKIELDMF
jgi:FeS assembly SUF system protein